MNHINQLVRDLMRFKFLCRRNAQLTNDVNMNVNDKLGS